MESAVPVLTPTPLSRQPSPLCNHGSPSLSLCGVWGAEGVKMEGTPDHTGCFLCLPSCGERAEGQISKAA